MGEPLTPEQQGGCNPALWGGSALLSKCQVLMLMSLTSATSLPRQKQMATEREKVGAEFQALRAFLVEQEGRLLGRLEELSREVTQKQNENLAQLGGEIAQLSKLTSQIQEDTSKPDLDFLQVSGSPGL